MHLKDLGAAQAQRVSALLDEALELAPAQHAAWQAGLADREPQLAGLVSELLASIGQAGREPMPETRELIERRFAQATREAPALDGRSFGPYRVLRLLGRGGMGAVWLAERADGLFERQVALKLMHASFAGSTLPERFTRERSILAALDHPHIARLLDAGVAEDGQPYLALEYVDGVPLTAYCDAERLSLRARIALLVQVLSAVQYAHQNLVVHRDLKPSNILVTRDGQAHLLDFGIAKLMVEGEARETELTQVGGRALTPDYAAPEQIAGRPVSTASDVYSLGVLLYELLCGQRPYHLARDTRGALEEAILNVEPVRPSQRELSDDIAHARSTTPKRLARSLAGDLDTIVLKVLKKNSAERYATADSFRQDLQRHLAGEAVLARPDSTLYRTNKFVRRHRFGVAATAVVLLALGAGLAGTAWQAQQARAQAQRAQAVQDFLIGLFNEADPVKAQGRELTAREMLDRGQRDLQTKLAGQPRLNAELDGVLANLYAKLSDETKALPLANARLALTLRLDGPQSLEYGDALYSLAAIQDGLTRNDLAAKTYGQARDVLRRYEPARRSQLLKIDVALSYALVNAGRDKEAVEALVALLPRLQDQFGARSWELIDAKALLSAMYAQHGETERALALGREIEPLLDSVADEHVLDAVIVRYNLGMARLTAWRPDEAQPLLRRALADFERLQGPETSTAMQAQQGLAMALFAGGQFEQAVRACDASIKRAVRVRGEDSPTTKAFESLCVAALIMVGRPGDAESLARRSMQGPAIPASASPANARDFENRLGLALVFNDKAREAVQLLEAIAAQARQAGLDKGDVHARTLLYLAGARSASGQPDAAAQAAAQAERLFATSARGADMFVANAQLTEALALSRSGQGARANELIAQAEAHLRKVSKPDHPVHLLVQLVQAEALRAGGRQAEGDRVDRVARERLQTTAGAVLPKVIPLIF